MTDSASCSSCQAVATPVVALGVEGPSSQPAYPPALRSLLFQISRSQLLARLHPPASSV